MATINPIWVPNTLTTVAAGLRYPDSNGDTVNTLYPLDYLILIGQDLAILSGTTNQLQAGYSDQATKILALQAAVATMPTQYVTPQISGQCLNSSVTQDIDDVLTLMVTAWCDFIAVAGTNAALNIAIATQCSNLNSSTAFSGGQMAAITGWKSSPSTLADTITNQWLTICDARVGIANALAAVTPGCNQVIIDYQVVLTESDSIFAFYFNSYTFIPSGFVDIGSQIKITDTAGNQYLQSLDIVVVSNSSGAYTIPLSGSTLQPNDTYTVTVTSDIRNSVLGLECVKTVIHSVYSNPVTDAACCPDTGTYNAYTSGSTQITLFSGLTYTPSYVGITPKNSFTAGLITDLNYSPYLSYISGGAVINFLGAPDGVVSLDYISYQ